MKNRKCEVCGKKSEVDLNMPLPIGMFKADLCMMCSFSINTQFKMVQKILEERAGLMGIKLPMDMKTANKVCGTKTADIKVK